MTFGGFLSISLFLGVSIWMLIALVRRMRRQSVSNRVWITFGTLFLLGIALGIWCGFYCEYSVGTRFRIGSFPIPVVFFHLEDGRWIDFPVPTFQAYVSAVADVITIMVLATLPTWLLLWRTKDVAPKV